MVTQEQLQAVLWTGVPGVGSKTLEKIAWFLRKRKVGWAESWKLLEKMRSELVLTERQLQQAVAYSQHKWSVQVLQQKLAEFQISVIGRASDFYPKLLAEVSDAPYFLFCIGDISLLKNLQKNPVVAVVGTRKISPYGKLVTQKIVEELVVHDTIIVSGGMYGVDATAHAAAVGSEGKTIAVLASGVAKVGAYWQQALCQQICAAGGVVLSEFFPWQGSQKNHFPIRNRVVAGLSQAVVVTEAAEKSGSLITAACAVEYDREVCAVPGPITSEFSQGTKWLLNQGATLVGTGQEVLEACNVWNSNSQSQSTERVSKYEKVDDGGAQSYAEMICSYLQSTTSGTTTQLAEHLKVSVMSLLPILSKLELTGRIISSENRWFLASLLAFVTIMYNTGLVYYVSSYC